MELGYSNDEIAELVRLKVSHDYLAELGGPEVCFYDPLKN